MIADRENNLVYVSVLLEGQFPALVDGLRRILAEHGSPLRDIHGTKDIWAVLVAECDELGGVQWKCQAADGMLSKARFGGEKVGKNPTDRGKMGTKKHLVTDGDGGPLGAVIAGANVPDCRRAAVDRALARHLIGWRGYFGLCQTPLVLHNLDVWIRRRLRMYI